MIKVEFLFAASLSTSGCSIQTASVVLAMFAFCISCEALYRSASCGVTTSPDSGKNNWMLEQYRHANRLLRNFCINQPNCPTRCFMLMKQISLAAAGFELVNKGTRNRKWKWKWKCKFLGEMNLMVPWAELTGLIEPHAPTVKRGARPSQWPLCCAFTSDNSGSACLTRPWKRPCTTCRCTASLPN